MKKDYLYDLIKTVSNEIMDIAEQEIVSNGHAFADEFILGVADRLNGTILFKTINENAACDKPFADAKNKLKKNLDEMIRLADKFKASKDTLEKAATDKETFN